MQQSLCADEVELFPEIDRCADMPRGDEHRVAYLQGRAAVMLEYCMLFPYLDDLEPGAG